MVTDGNLLLSHNLSHLSGLFEPVSHGVLLLIPFAIAGLVITLIKRSVYTAAIIVFFVLLLFASAINKYPVISHLWMFLYPILFIYAFVFIDALRISISEGKAAKILQKVIPLFLAALLLVPNMSFTDFGRGSDWTLVPGNQANPLIAYVKENIREGEFLYSSETANLIVRYKNGYDSNRIGNVDKDNIIFGSPDIDGDLGRIVGTSGSYVLFYNSYYPFSQDPDPKEITKGLMNLGFMEQIMNVNHTYLYWFTDDISRVRGSASFEVSGLVTEDGSLSGLARIENNGSAILAPEKPDGHPEPDDIFGWDDFGRLLVVLYESDGHIPSSDISGGMIVGEFPAPIKPGESFEILINYSGLEPGEYQIELVAFGKYSFSELGIFPVLVTVV